MVFEGLRELPGKLDRVDPVMQVVAEPGNEKNRGPQINSDWEALGLPGSAGVLSGDPQPNHLEDRQTGER